MSGMGSPEDLLRYCSNAGRWGPDDDRGTANLIDVAAVKRALREASEGHVVALGRAIIPTSQRDDCKAANGECGVATGNDTAMSSVPGAVRLSVFYSGPERRAALDTVTMSPHGYEVTHLDAIGHSFIDGRGYNGRYEEDMFSADGLHFASIAALGEGVVTRGVFLDVAGLRGKERLENNEYISPGDLRGAERRARTTVMPGDAVFIRAGTRGAGPDSEGRRPGLSADSVVWLYEHEVALYSGDCIERLPGEDARIPMPLHQVGHVGMGLLILDNPDVEVLKAACGLHGRATFCLIVAPLRIVGATGSAVNPLAIF